MPRLIYSPEAFGRYMGAAFTAPAEIVFSWDEICHAAVTVGRGSWLDVFRFGTYSVLEAMWRLAMVRANLVEDSNGRLRKSRAFAALDPSEKSAVSYFLGLVVTKLITARLFGVTWLLHLDVYRRSLNPTFALSDRPDFVGLNSANLWVVIESKGRTNGASSRLLDSAKQQTRSLRRIGGQMPVLRAAIATYFSSGSLRARVRDPEDFEPNAPDVPLAGEDLVRAYYRPLVELIEHLPHERRQNPETGQTNIRAVLPIVDAGLELDERIFRWYASSSATLQELDQISPQPVHVLEQLIRQREMAEKERPVFLTITDRVEALGVRRLGKEQAFAADGVVVTLGELWNTERMRLEPEERES